MLGGYTRIHLACLCIILLICSGSWNPLRYVGISSKLVPKVYCLLFEYQFAKYPPHPLAWLWACPLALAVLHTFQFWGWQAGQSPNNSRSPNLVLSLAHTAVFFQFPSLSQLLYRHIILRIRTTIPLLHLLAVHFLPFSPVFVLLQ